jgi:CBS domain-containing protein
MPFTVKELIGDRSKPVTARPEESVEQALVRMHEQDFSQLPVVTEDERPIGVLTNGSILRALRYLGTPLNALRVRDAMEEKPDEYQSDDDLFDLLDDLRDTYAVLIVNAEGRLTGIVTSYDTTEFFRRKAEDMMLVEDIESALKDLIHSAFSDPDDEADEAALGEFIAAVAGSRQERRTSSLQIVRRYLAETKGAEAEQGGAKFDEDAFHKVFDKVHPAPASRSLDDLTLNDQIQLFLHDRTWTHLRDRLGLDRSAIRRMLDGARMTRNSLAHFRGTISPIESDRLRFCVEWLLRAQRAMTPQRVAVPVNLTPASVPATVMPAIVGTGEVVPEADEVKPEDSRYAPLAVHLQSRPQQLEYVELSFSQIEELIHGRLPATARQHRSWWANDSHSHVQSRQWLDVGWRVEAVDFGGERVTFVRARARDQLYAKFYRELQDVLNQKARFSLRFSKNPSMSWIWVANLPEGGPTVAHLGFSFAMGRRFRVELYIDSGDAENNKRVFDALQAQREAIDTEMGIRLQWERLDAKRASRVAAYQQASITDDSQALNTLREWAVATMLRFQSVIELRLKEAVRQLAA